MYRRVCGPEGWDEELLERGEKPVGAEDEPFRVEVVGSNPAGPTTRRTDPIEAKIFNTLWALKKNGYSEATLKAKEERLRYLANPVNLDDPEAVKECVANQTHWSNAYKQGIAHAYNNYAKINSLQWNLPHLRVEDKLPEIPAEEKINQICVRAFTCSSQPDN